MNTDKATLYDFHQALGQLFYAIALSDKVLREEEMAMLDKMINSEWLPIDKNAGQVRMTFNKVKEQGKTAQECMEAFESFYQTHKNLFREEVLERVWKSVNSIASACAGKNKSELVMLSKLSVILKE